VAKLKRSKQNGKLSDLAPTILKLMDLPIPEAMTANNLLVG
jgi:bisphosphoglycerate-independent phosphoglycerate mutase (AlkP superfamily)